MDASIRHLSKHPLFKPLVKKYGRPTLKRGRTPFQALCRAIIYQQISGKAAGSIYAKFVALFGIAMKTPIDWESRAASRFPTPEAVLSMPESSLRSAGLSSQKIAYIRDLAQKFSDGSVPHKKLSRMPNDEIVAVLTEIKGIGVWTVQMFLIFTLNRLDVLPTGDLGIQKGFMVLYKMKSLPAPRTMERLAKDWREHASVASWYLWRVADDAAKR